MQKIKVYLDNCAYNRPFDDQSDIRIRLESEAKLFIQEQIKDNRCTLNQAVLQKALELQSHDIRAKDALHIAAAIDSGCGFFITTDRKILNKKIDGVAVVNPIIFVEEYLK